MCIFLNRATYIVNAGINNIVVGNLYILNLICLVEIVPDSHISL